MSKYLRLLRLNQPTGVALLFLPCLWGLAIAKADFSQWIKLFIVFGLGSIIMRGAGCIINDLIDIDIDAQVARTKTRPLASKEVSKMEAYVLLIILLMLGLYILTFLNALAALISIGSMLLVVLYPFMKRITYWPQLFLGVTFNIGILVAYATICSQITLAAVLIYLAGVFWTLAYDTIYGFQDIKDDMRIGVKSSAMVIRNYAKPVLAIFYICMMALLSSQCNFMWLLPAIFLVLYIVIKLDINNPTNCLAAFKLNMGVGAFVLVALIAN